MQNKDQPNRSMFPKTENKGKEGKEIVTQSWYNVNSLRKLGHTKQQRMYVDD